MKRLMTQLGLAGVIATMGVSCTTSYDQYGRAQPAVSPGGALLGAVAIGAIAYSVGKDNGKHKSHHSSHGYSHGGYGHGGYSGGHGGGGYTSGYGRGRH